MARTTQTLRKSTKPRKLGKDKPTKSIKKKRTTKKPKEKTASRPKKPTKVVSKSKAAETKDKGPRAPRRRGRGELAAKNMFALQLRGGIRQRIENTSKFNRSMYTCFRNIIPFGCIGSDAARLISQDVNSYGQKLVMKALEFSLSSDKKCVKVTADNIISALATDKTLLAGITPHSVSRPVGT